MSIILYEGKNRASSPEIVINSDQVLVLTIFSDVDITPDVPNLIVERKNSKNQFRPFSLNDGIFCVLGYNSPTVSIPIAGTYRITRPDLTNTNVNIGVDYTISYGESDFDQPLSLTRSNKDENGIFTTLTYTRQDSTVAKESVLSGGTSPEYTTRTETWYASDGQTVINTLVFSLTYDGDGELVGETLQ